MLKPVKSLGQNFLRDENILRKIVEALSIEPDDVVLEIGPGQGELTKYLCDKPINLLVVEVDKRAIQILKERFGNKFEIIHQNILDVQLEKIYERYNKKIHIVGNIPYYLTSEILIWLFDSYKFVIDGLLMVQLELAYRINAKPKTKEYGILSVYTKFFTESELLFKVSRNSFFPKPDVDSAVVKLNFKNQLPNINIELFKLVVRTTFGQRRKTLKNSLKKMGLDNSILDNLSLDLNKRPEELEVAEFVLLTNELQNLKNRLCL